MTISVETTKNTYPGTGSQTTFPYTFKIDADADLGVLTEDANGVQTTYVLDTDYTVTGEGEQTGGNCVFVTPPAAGVTVVLFDDVNFKQEVDYQQGDSFPAEVHESALDKLTRQNLKQKEEIGRAVKFSIASDASDVTIPDPDAGKWLAWNDAGTNLTNKNDPTTNTTASAAAAAASAAAAAASASAASSSASSAASEASDAADSAAEAEGYATAAELAAANVNNQRYEHIVQTASDTFTMPFAAQSSSSAVYVDGVRQFPGAFVMDTRTITFDEELPAGTELFIVTPENDVTGSDAVRAQKNAIANGSMSSWRGGTSFTISTAETDTADQWTFYHYSDHTYAVSASTTVPNSRTKYSQKLSVTVVGTTQTDSIAYLSHAIEGNDFLPYVGEQGTLSFDVRASVAGTYCVCFSNYEGDNTYIAEYTIANANTWESQSITVPFTAASGIWAYNNNPSLLVKFIVLAGTDYQEASYLTVWDSTAEHASTNQTDLTSGGTADFYLTNVQLELGDTKTGFEYLNAAEEKDRLNRYFTKSYEDTTAPGSTTTAGCYMSMTVSGTTHMANVRFPQELATTSEVTIYSLDGTADCVSLVDMALTHIEDVPVSSILNQSKKGFTALTLSSGISLAAFHWTANATLWRV